jgi:hypothetical protein
MASERVKCKECDAMILLSTAEKNKGLCAQCIKISPEERASLKKYEAMLQNGDLWLPSDEELNSERNPFESKNNNWGLDPEFYEASPIKSVAEVINDAKQLSSGNVFLLSKAGSRLNLSFSEKYGVVEYQNENEGDYLCAYTPHNLKKQVEKSFQVDQACACCGVSLLTYPSRTHMPRDMAFSILVGLISNLDIQDVKWLDFGDISYVSPGHG